MSGVPNNYLENGDLRRQFLEELKRNRERQSAPRNNGGSSRTIPIPGPQSVVPKGILNILRELFSKPGTSSSEGNNSGDNGAGNKWDPKAYGPGTTWEEHGLKKNSASGEQSARLIPRVPESMRNELNLVEPKSPWDMASLTPRQYAILDAEMNEVGQYAIRINNAISGNDKETATKEMYDLYKKYGQSPRWSGMVYTLADAMNYVDPTSGVTEEPSWDSAFVKNFRNTIKDASSKRSTKIATDGILNHIKQVRKGWKQKTTI